MPHTCALLDELLMPIIEEFWSSHKHTDLQFKNEVLDFFVFMQDVIKHFSIPYLRDTLLLEGLLVFSKFFKPTDTKSLTRVVTIENSLISEGGQSFIFMHHELTKLVQYLLNGKKSTVAYDPKWYPLQDLLAA
jgi:hypothetical protein